MTDNIKLPPLPEGNVAHLIAAQAAEIERLRARIAELEKYKLAVEQHNRECDDLCNNAATCGYKQYFDANGRRCTTCPVDMKINVLMDGC